MSYAYPDTWTAFRESVTVNVPLGRRFLLYGPPGTGKSTAAQKYGLRDEDDAIVITLTEETPAAELRGHYLRKGTETVWHHGVVSRAMLEGKRLVINEVNFASPDVLAYLMVALDDKNVSELSLPTGETIRPHDGYHVIGTMNGEPDELPDPLAERFAVKLRITEPNPEGVAALPADLRDAAVESVKHGDDRERYISLRSWHNFASYRGELGAEKAAYLVFGSRGRDVLLSMRIGDASDKRTRVKASAVTSAPAITPVGGWKRGRMGSGETYRAATFLGYGGREPKGSLRDCATSLRRKPDTIRRAILKDGWNTRMPEGWDT